MGLPPNKKQDPGRCWVVQGVCCCKMLRVSQDLGRESSEEAGQRTAHWQFIFRALNRVAGFETFDPSKLQDSVVSLFAEHPSGESFAVLLDPWRDESGPKSTTRKEARSLFRTKRRSEIFAQFYAQKPLSNEGQIIVDPPAFQKIFIGWNRSSGCIIPSKLRLFTAMSGRGAELNGQRMAAPEGARRTLAFLSRPMFGCFWWFHDARNKSGFACFFWGLALFSL